MSCSTCGRENRPDARFCDGCGEARAHNCGGCGTTLRADARFCDACGVAVGSPALKASGEIERTPRDYTPKHLADKILQSKSALEGERKQVTLLFADVKGSMELAEQLGEPIRGAVMTIFLARYEMGGSNSIRFHDGWKTLA